MSTLISSTILRQLADSVDGFPGGPITELVDANPSAIAGLLYEALTRAFRGFESIQYNVSSFWPDSDGLSFEANSTDYEGHIRKSHTISLTWDELLDEETLPATLVESRFEALSAAKAASERKAKQRERDATLERTRPAREAADRAELARLKAIYEAPKS